jgi:hypothetical protein
MDVSVSVVNDEMNCVLIRGQIEKSLPLFFFQPQ